MPQDLLLFSEKDFWNLIHNQHSVKGGAYKIVAARKGERIPINRFLGTDKEGVLYIGKATSFIERVIDLKKSISPDFNGSAHICGRRYKSNPNIAKLFPFEVLHIELFQTDRPDELERSMLREYSNIYGEVPPLNAVG